MKFVRMQLEIESSEERADGPVAYSLAESFHRIRAFDELAIDLTGIDFNYGNHRGYAPLRALVADLAGDGISDADVLITTGAAGALFAITVTLVTPGDHMIVVRPNYSNNIETPRALDVDVSYLELGIENGFHVDVEEVRSLITPKTRVISITSPHNPSGVSVPEATIRELAEIAASHHLRLIVDETYRDLAIDPPPSAATIGPQVLAVSSMSKTFGMPGLRVGWVVATDSDLMQRILGAKEQISLTGSILDERIASELLSRRSILRPSIERGIEEGRAVVEEWMQSEPALEWVAPDAGVVCFPRIVDPLVDVPAFYEELERLDTAVGPGRWFERPDTHFRIGYGHLSEADLRIALRNVSSALRKARR